MVVDSVNATVLWAGTWEEEPRSDLSSLQTRSDGVIVRFQIIGAQLYALRFVP